MLLILTGCNYNDNALPVQHETEVLGKTGHYNDFPELGSLFNKAMPQYSTSSVNSTSNQSSIYNFKIDSAYVTKRVDPKGTYYTMAIYRDSTYKFVENLVICNNGTDTKAFIVTYFSNNAFEQKENSQYHLMVA